MAIKVARRDVKNCTRRHARRVCAREDAAELLAAELLARRGLDGPPERASDQLDDGADGAGVFGSVFGSVIQSCSQS
jgi:hypothetical protein